jgi:hypothetical protein
MRQWTKSELEKIASSDELEIAPVRGDGTRRKPVTIWVVRHADDLYVRSWRGRGARWFRDSQERHRGHIRAGGVERDVEFAEVDESVNDAIDAAYQDKYRRHGPRYVDPMVAAPARAATIKLAPRDVTIGNSSEA